MLGLTLNGRDSAEVVPVEFRDDRFWLRASDLQRAGIPPSKISAPLVDVTTMDGVKSEYDRPGQRIVLTVPADWLPVQTLSDGAATNGPRYAGLSSKGALFNYDMYTSQTTGGGTRMSISNELRIFGGYGQFTSNGIWQQQLSGGESYSDEGYVRYDTWWANQNEDDALGVRIGDLISDSLTWSNSVRMGGIQLGRDFTLRPDLITYPLPSFSGQAAVPSTVDLFVNGYKTSSNAVQSGPYSLTNMPFVNGAGNAVVVTTDALGRRVSTTLPFYVASSLLKSGLSDFSIAAGALRENYGLKNFDYGPAVTSGSYRYGLNDWLTLESHAEAAESLALGGGGVQMRIGSLGVVNGAVSQSRMEGSHGNQYSWGYQYSTTRFNVGTQHTIRSAGYGDLGLYGERQRSDDYANFSYLSRRSSQYSGSVSLDQYGNLGAAYIDITNTGGDRTRLLNLSWSKGLWGSSSLYVSASRDVEEGDWSGSVSLSIPFGTRSSASVSMERNRDGNNSQRLYVSQSMASDGGFAYDASWANQRNDGDYRQASLRWRNQKIEAAGGYYGDDRYSTTWGELSGSLVLMDNSLFAANEVSDAFVLVKTGYPAVNVRYENQRVGKTDKQGYLLVPHITAWYPAKYEIDTLDLPANMTASTVEQRLSVRRQSGYLLEMPVTSLRAASVILHDQTGNPLPVSTVVTRPGQPSEIVGWDGMLWMENLATRNLLHAETPDGRRCDTELSVASDRPESIVTYGPLTCALSSPPSGKTP